MRRRLITIGLIILALPLFTKEQSSHAAKPVLRVGVSAVPVTPFGVNPEWDGTITESGIWGEKFTDQNGNHVWDSGEPFEDDPRNTAIDSSSKSKYDGIYLAGFGNHRLATGKHDDLWARTIVLDDGKTRFAIVSVDFLGYYSESSFYGINHIRNLVDARLGVQEILVASTHNHEGPDTIGPWGNGPLSDGKYPMYLQFVDRQIARSISLAVAQLTPAQIRIGVTDPQKSPSIARMQTRTRARPPEFFDEELRVMQFIATAGRLRNKPIATLINWNTHPESMEDKNTEITSDFPHTIRSEVESRYGGIAVYLSGAIGAVEIVGDSNTRSSDRTRFDGREFPFVRGNRPSFTHERTAAIGRDIASAAIDAVSSSVLSSSDVLQLKKADLHGPMDNGGYALLIKIGVLDNLAAPAEGGSPVFKTWIYNLTIGDAQLITAPGELMPEIYFGVGKAGRKDCPQADTGRPREPAIRDAMTGKFRFLIGLCPDELGYIVPGYDWQREPFDPAKMEVREAPDACKALGVANHYHETNSSSSILAPATSCVAVALLTGRQPLDKACENAQLYSDYYKSLPR
jgi:hypothetical protein